MGLSTTLFSVFVVVGFCVLQIDWASGFVCYQCSDTGGNSDCRDYKALVKAALTNGSLIRNCTNDLYCMTEKYVKQGVDYSFIRGCSNNTADDFSFGKTGRLKMLKPDNVTICTFDVKSMGQECVSLCNSNFCNGPIAGAERSLLSGKTVFVAMLTWFIFLHVLQ
ncbi:ly6/PLAUR domain-containing protein 1-like [Gigantopelta aegis]|uniref:ly6/PLAUR domain-containing protein 1-like n=1 Tax=Gigantopelta aegis TaxID=1735272 RepID=UPI001B88752C|nr:ly6/PLAUR domain-containing protein 1-like [Gigantopelta aegis]